MQHIVRIHYLLPSQTTLILDQMQAHLIQFFVDFFPVLSDGLCRFNEADEDGVVEVGEGGRDDSVENGID